MKKITFAAVAMMLLTACSSPEQAPATIDISGTITGLGDESIVLRYRFESTTYMDTITATDGAFAFSKEITLPNPVWATLIYIGEQEVEHRFAEFFIDNGVAIAIEGDLNNLRELNAHNSPLFSDVVKLREQNKRDGFDFAKMAENRQNFIDNNKDSEYAAYLYTATLLRKSAEEVEADFLQFTEKVRNSVFGQLILTYIETARNTAPGAPAPNFTQHDIDGNIITLEQFKGKHVMLIFWGSWCGPCRRSHPHLMELVNKYKDDNIVFIGFASDRDKDKWKEAIAADGLDFIHCNLFDRLDGEDVQAMYNVRAFPTKVFIDAEGKIVNTIIGSGDEEKKALEEMLVVALGR